MRVAKSSFKVQTAKTDALQLGTGCQVKNKWPERLYKCPKWAHARPTRGVYSPWSLPLSLFPRGLWGNWERRKWNRCRCQHRKAGGRRSPPLSTGRPGTGWCCPPPQTSLDWESPSPSGTTVDQRECSTELVWSPSVLHRVCWTCRHALMSLFWIDSVRTDLLSKQQRHSDLCFCKLNYTHESDSSSWSKCFIPQFDGVTAFQQLF